MKNVGNEYQLISDRAKIVKNSDTCNRLMISHFQGFERRNTHDDPKQPVKNDLRAVHYYD